jgi:hypothetical protein
MRRPRPELGCCATGGKKKKSAIMKRELHLIGKFQKRGKTTVFNKYTA